MLLSRALGRAQLVPAVDLETSSTRREEDLMHPPSTVVWRAATHASRDSTGSRAWSCYHRQLERDFSNSCLRSRSADDDAP
ncbi:hypothetical protein [Nonomuraea dietziae]|uniref:hypothetical protein n=1 Tax=Nonomuraea dietziae TaxID=65515 RepID=UPI0031D3823F